MCICCESVGCEGDGNAGVGSGGGVVVVSACMSGTRGSGVMSNTGDVLEMSVVRGVGGVCDMCMCLARAVWVERGGEWMRELGLASPILWGQGECWTCVCVLVAVVWVV